MPQPLHDATCAHQGEPPTPRASASPGESTIPREVPRPDWPDAWMRLPTATDRDGGGESDAAEAVEVIARAAGDEEVSRAGLSFQIKRGDED